MIMWFLRLTKKHGKLAVTIFVTVPIIFFSMSFAIIDSILLDHELIPSLYLSMIIPCVLAPPVVYLLLTLVVKLEHTESELDTVIENAADAIFLHDRTGKIIKVNKAACNALHYDRNELLALNINDVQQVQKPENNTVPWDDLYPGRPLTVEGVYRRKDGSRFPVETRLNTFEGDTKEYVLALVRDVTERKKIEDQLRDSEIRNSTLLEGSPVCNKIIDLDSRLQYMSSAGVMDLKISNIESLYGSVFPFQSCYPESIRTSLTDHLERAKAGEVSNLDCPVHDTEGNELWYNTTFVPARDAEGQTMYVIATSVNITERKQTEVAQSRISRAIEKSPIGMVLWDNANRFVLCNDYFRELYSYLSHLLIPGTSFEEFIRAQAESGQIKEANGRIDEFVERRILAISQGDTLFDEVMEDGRTIQVQRHLLEDGSKISYLIDITEKISRDEQLRHAQKMEVVGQLSSGIAHDFNNLLMAALGNIEILGEIVSDNEKAKKHTNTAINAILRGADLTSRLLSFSRKQNLDPERINVREFVTDLETLFRRTLPESIDIDLKIPEDTWPVMADKGQLESSILNLVLNSRDAMPAGGALTISGKNVEISPLQQIQRPEFKVGDFLAISVEDTGTGISKQNLERIVDPFFTTKGVGKGSGLGLSMVYGFVVQSGGFVDIESEIAAGTKVTLYLPRDEKFTEDLKVPEAEEVTQLGLGEKILVVEDEPDVREITVQLLEKLGYEVVDGGDGFEIFNNCRRDNCSYCLNVDVILSDVVLPNGISGPKLIENMLKFNPDAKPILMTGYAESEVLKPKDNSSIYPVLSKPFSKKDLAMKISNALKGE